MISTIPGVRVGHWTNPEVPTGCTVIIPPLGTTGSVYVPGNAPASRETEVIGKGRRVHTPSAIVFSGGSAFGLAAADGAVRWLEEQGIGHQTPIATIPIVPAACIFDGSAADRSLRPGPDQGYAACEAAREGPHERGSVGAGAGGNVGKIAGFENAHPGGVGAASRAAGEATVAALAVANAVGNIVEDDGTIIAGGAPRADWHVPPGTSTTLVCVVTDARLTRDDCYEVARAASAGIWRAVRPVTMFDGDVVFALATGSVDVPRRAVEAVASAVVADAIRDAVIAARA